MTAVRSAQRGAGAWTVTVAAQYANGSVRYYAVPVASDSTGSSFTVTGAPGVVAGPARAEVPKSSYAVTVPEGDLSSAVGEFLTASLTGAGEVDRYLAPGVQLTAVSPAPYSAVAVQQVSAIEEAAAAGVRAIHYGLGSAEAMSRRCAGPGSGGSRKRRRFRWNTSGPYGIEASLASTSTRSRPCWTTSRLWP